MISSTWKRILEIILIFYKDQLRAGNLTYHPECFRTQNNIIDKDMTKTLEDPFTQQEVFLATKDLRINVASSLNGIPALFYQSYCTIVGDDISATVHNILTKK